MMSLGPFEVMRASAKLYRACAKAKGGMKNEMHNGTVRCSPTFARFFLHSVQALGVTTPKPRLRLDASVLAAPALADVEGASCFWDLDEVEVRSADVPRPCSSSMMIRVRMGRACSWTGV